MSIFTEAPYILALKEEFLRSRCSTCFKSSCNSCPECKVIVYCNDECRINDSVFHKFECEAYKNCSKRNENCEFVIVRMMVRVITRLSIDGGEPEIDLCSNVPKSIHRRSWSDLLGHRDEIPHCERHFKEWLNTKNQFHYLFDKKFNEIDLLEIFGKILINRFRVGIHENILDGRIALGWAIYLTTSRFNHSCQPDLLQCSYDINMRLKFANKNEKIPETTFEFDRLTVSYRHQNDFRLTNPLSYVPTRRQRRRFVSFFFFNCHCLFCSDDLRNRYSESATNRLCKQCGDFLVLQENYHDPTLWIFTCLGRKKCLSNEKIVDHINISIIDDNDQQSIEIYEEKLEKIEELLHPHSILLLQQREKVFFTYQKLLNQSNLNENQRINFIHRAIQLGEILIEVYHIHLKHSSIYPKTILTDLANLYENIHNKIRAKQLYQQAIDLWKNDYENYIDYRYLDLKL